MSSKKKILMVLTRDVDEIVGDGRIRTLRLIRKAFCERYAVREAHIRTVIELRNFYDSTESLFSWVGGVLKGRGLPLQCALFQCHTNRHSILNGLRDFIPDSIYLDSIRTLPFIREIKERFPNTPIVMDMDDLMSRRIGILNELNEPVAMGYLRKVAPSWLIRLLQLNHVARWLIGYERKTLVGAENDAARLVNAVVLVSTLEGKMLEERLASLNDRKKINVIHPAFAIVRRMRQLTAGNIRFVFVGSDSQTQNRLTIDWLIKVWSDKRITSRLHIYGRKTREYPLVSGVVWEGYVEDLGDVYTNDSILIAPAFLGGGTKTKVLEAVSYGCVALTNSIGLEGLGMDKDPVCAMSLDEMVEILCAPGNFIERLEQVGDRLMKKVLDECNWETFVGRWVSALGA